MTQERGLARPRVAVEQPASADASRCEVRRVERQDFLERQASGELAGPSQVRSVLDLAPDFTVADTDGNRHTLSALLANGPVIVAFFPKAFTPG